MAGSHANGEHCEYYGGSSNCDQRQKLEERVIDAQKQQHRAADRSDGSCQERTDSEHHMRPPNPEPLIL